MATATASGGSGSALAWVANYRNGSCPAGSPDTRPLTPNTPQSGSDTVRWPSGIHRVTTPGVAAPPSCAEAAGGCLTKSQEDFINAQSALEAQRSPVASQLTWDNLDWYTKTGKTEKRVLHGLSGCAARGQLLAVLGPSGSGKTTLLDILAMRKSTGRTSGAVRVGGQERRQGAYQRASAFVLQDAVLLPTLTVGETMRYYAAMQPNFVSGGSSSSKGRPMPAKDAMSKPLLPRSYTLSSRRIDEALRLVGLAQNTDRLVGGPLPGGISLQGLSSGERRRLSIAASTLKDPSLVFADEPTTGIDSFASLRVLEALKDLARAGKTVVVTIHQPREGIWKLFDQIYLLSEGRLMYSGTPSGATSWFATRGCGSVPVGVSVADWLLDVVTVGFESKKDLLGWGGCFSDLSDVSEAAIAFSASTRMAEIREEIVVKDRAARTEGTSDVLWPPELSDVAHRTFESRCRQSKALLVRHCLNYMRNLGNVVARWLLALVSGLLVGICYSGLRRDHLDEVAASDPRTLSNHLGCLFFCCMVLLMSPNCSMALFVTDRRFYSAEAAACMYSSIAYYVPLALCELVVNAVAASIFWTVVALLSGTGLHAGFGSYWRGLLSCGLLQLCGAQIVAACAMWMPNQELAFVASVASNIVAMMTAGFLIKTTSLPSYVAWMRYLSPVKFGFHALVVNEISDRDFDVGAQVHELEDALCQVGRSGCARDGVKQPSAALKLWLQQSELRGVTRSMLGDILETIDPCLLGTVSHGQEALVCLELDEPSPTMVMPSFVALALQLLVLHICGWLFLRHFNKERR